MTETKGDMKNLCTWRIYLPWPPSDITDSYPKTYRDVLVRELEKNIGRPLRGGVSLEIVLVDPQSQRESRQYSLDALEAGILIIEALEKASYIYMGREEPRINDISIEHEPQAISESGEIVLSIFEVQRGDEKR